MKAEDITIIKEEVNDLPNLPNGRLIELMDKLSLEFDETKNAIIDFTYHLDNVEILYNKILSEYQKRNK